MNRTNRIVTFQIFFMFHETMSMGERVNKKISQPYKCSTILFHGGHVFFFVVNVVTCKGSTGWSNQPTLWLSSSWSIPPEPWVVSPGSSQGAVTFRKIYPRYENKKGRTWIHDQQKREEEVLKGKIYYITQCFYMWLFELWTHPNPRKINIARFEWNKLPCNWPELFEMVIRHTFNRRPRRPTWVTSLI